MGCRFCASTIAGFKRDLTSSEILGQIYASERDSGRKISGVVLMGIGEPMDNFDNVVNFLEVLSCPKGFNMSLRHVSVSTCGIVPRIYELAEKKLGITFIYITHDQEEALTMSDRIAVMHKGILEQVCSPKELYMKPKTKYVAEFIGESNIFEGVVKDRNSDKCTVAIESGNILCSGDDYVAGQMVYVCIRPEKVRITRKAGSGNSLPAEIKEQIFTGNMMKHIAVLSNGHEIKAADIASYNDINIGDKVYLEWDAKDAVMIKNPTGPMAENFDTLRGVQ